MTASAIMRNHAIETVDCPICKQPMEMLEHTASCANDECQGYDKSYVVELPKINVTLREV